MQVSRLNDLKDWHVLAWCAAHKLARHAKQLPVSADRVFDYIDKAASLGNAWVVSGYLVVYALEVPDFSTELVLVEKCVVRLDGEAMLTHVPAFLVAEAARRNARWVVAGDCISGVMQGVYAGRSSAFRQLGVSFVAEVGKCAV